MHDLEQPQALAASVAATSCAALEVGVRHAPTEAARGGYGSHNRSSRTNNGSASASNNNNCGGYRAHESDGEDATSRRRTTAVRRPLQQRWRRWAAAGGFKPKAKAQATTGYLGLCRLATRDHSFVP